MAVSLPFLAGAGTAGTAVGVMTAAEAAMGAASLGAALAPFEIGATAMGVMTAAEAAAGAASLGASLAPFEAGAAAGGLGTIGNKALEFGIQGAASTLLSPTMEQQAPTVKPVTEMPDPLAQQEAKKRALTEQMARRGRASTIMTAPSGSGKLGN